jgi:hypothetical protein
VPTADAIDATRQATLTSRRQIADAGRAAIVMGWARGTLTVATGAVLVLVMARVELGRSLFGALQLSGQPGSFASEFAEFTAAVLPGLLVAWCLGFAAAATAVRATWLGARVTGILAGGVGVAAGTTLFLLSR